MRAFRKNIANELKDLPLKLTVHGGAVAMVVGPEFEPENPKIQEPEIIEESQLSPRAGDSVTLDDLRARYEARERGDARDSDDVIINNFDGTADQIFR